MRKKDLGRAEPLAVSREFDVNEETVIAAVTSLLRWPLVRFDTRDA
jgi:hypothetical protein